MTNYFKLDFKRALFSKTTLVALVLTLTSLMIPFIKEICWVGPFHANFVYMFDVGHNRSQNSYFCILAPIFAAIPFSYSYVQDKKSGFLNYILTRINFKKYTTTRIIVNSLIGGLILFFSLTILLILSIALNTFNGDPAIDLIPGVSNIIAIFIMITLSFFFGAVFSTIAIGFSSIFNSELLAVVAPFLYYMFLSILFSNLYKGNLSPVAIINPLLHNNNNTLSIITLITIHGLIGIGLCYYGFIIVNNKEHNYV